MSLFGRCRARGDRAGAGERRPRFASQTFASLSIPNYRRYAAGGIVSNTGTWMQRIAQDWLVLTVLTDHSGVAVGLTTGLQFLPTLLLTPLAGLIADRYPKRRVLIITQVAAGILALVLGVLVLLAAAQLWHVYLMATLLGVVTAIEAPTRQTFVSELVAGDRLANAVGLNSASFHAGRLIGPGLAGLGIGLWGTGPVFLLNAATYVATVLALLLMNTAELIPAIRAPRAKGQIRAGLSYLRSRRDLVLILTVMALVGTFSLNFQLTTALMATQVYGKGAEEYGLLGSIMAIGSLAGALLAARRGQARLRLMLGAAFVVGVATLVSSTMPTYPLFAISLIPIGLASLTMMTAANTIVQLTTEPSMRGRVMSVYMAVFLGGTPIGSPIVGWIGEQFGARWTLVVGGSVPLVCAVVGAGVLLRVQHRVVETELGRHPRLRLSAAGDSHALVRIVHPTTGAELEPVVEPAPVDPDPAPAGAAVTDGRTGVVPDVSLDAGRDGESDETASVRPALAAGSVVGTGDRDAVGAEPSQDAESGAPGVGPGAGARAVDPEALAPAANRAERRLPAEAVAEAAATRPRPVRRPEPGPVSLVRGGTVKTHQGEQRPATDTRAPEPRRPAQPCRQRPLSDSGR